MERKVTLQSTRVIKVVTPGASGKPGKTAYQVWLDEGNVGTVADFFTYLGRQSIHVGTQPPEDAIEGQLWIDTN